VSIGAASWFRSTGEWAVLILLVPMLVACGSGKPVEQPPQGDTRLERTSRVARIAFQHGRYAQAASLYRQAADLAYERDDIDAAVDAQYNAVVCLVRLDRIDEADGLLQRTKGELVRAGRTEPVEVRLLEATVLYRRSHYQQAWSLSEKIITDVPDSQAARRAQFLRGLIAADQGDQARLRAAIAELGAADDDRLEADRLELTGHLALLEQRYDASVADFAESARLRSASSDYRSTVRALAKAGEAAEAAGRLSQGSVHYLRAGRSALHQGAGERAHDLLTRARTLAERAGDSDTAREARLYLTLLEESEPESAPGN
jgi:tetratricopeptide (TPR) repeat protein